MIPRLISVFIKLRNCARGFPNFSKTIVCIVSVLESEHLIVRSASAKSGNEAWYSKRKSELINRENILIPEI
jgi:hypothetical protein